MAWYENWFGSPFYKILYQNRDEVEAQEFIENLVRSLQPADGCRMLDIACGEGRHARQLAGYGYDVTGIDISHTAVEEAKAYEHEKLHFYVQDMQLPFYINYFDFAFNFFTSFGYFKYKRSHQLAAKSFAAALKPGGVLVIDYLNAHYIMDNLVSDSIVERGSYKFIINKKVENKRVIKNIRFTDADGEERHYTETVAIFLLDDFMELFGKAGMELEATYGDYQLNPYDELTSQRMVMVFKKK